MINILCYFNLVFFLTQIIQFVFLRKLDRKFPFPTISLFTDLILFIVSLYTGFWIQYKIQTNIEIEGISEKEKFYRILANLNSVIDEKFEYLLTIMISCIIMKIIDII